MSSSPRPNTAPSRDSRIPDIAQPWKPSQISYEPRSATRGERSEPSPTALNSSPITSDDRRTAITAPGIPTVEAQPQGDAPSSPRTAVAPRTPLPSPADDPWMRKTLLTLGISNLESPGLTTKLMLSRWWRYQRLLKPFDSSRTYDPHCDLRAEGRTSG